MPEVDINKAWEISPYNGTAFGALIVFLTIAIWGLTYYFMKQLDKKDVIIKEKEDYIKEIHVKTHEAIDVMTEKLTELKYSNDATKEKFISFFEIIKDKLNKIN